MAIELTYTKSIQGDGACNEDAFGFAKGAAWVMDGATGLGDVAPDDGGTAAARFVNDYSEALQQLFAMQEPPDTRAILKTAIDRVGKTWRANGWAPEPKAGVPPSATLILVRDRGDSVELACLGDSRAILRRRNTLAEPFGESFVERLDARLMDEFRRIRATAPDTTLREVNSRLAPQIIANRKRMNSPDGYWILSFAHEAADHADLAIVQKSSLTHSEIVLATDGFLRLVEIYGVASYSDILEASIDRLDAYFDELRALEWADPEARRFPRLKSSDDATCIRCCLV